MRFSREQESAIRHKEGPALVLAVPGAGKTTVIIHRTYGLIHQYGVDPSSILSITFSRASARDMSSRYRRSFTGSPVPDFSTIHAFCFSVVRDFAKKSGKSFRLIEDEGTSINKFSIVKNLYLEKNGYQITEEKLESFFSHAGYIKNMMLDLKEYDSARSSDIEGFHELFTAYEDFKKKNRLIDFDDMLGIAYRLLIKHPSLLANYRSRYRYVQLDEGQDTSKLQLVILRLLSEPGNNLFIVADDDQSIYGFRGAHPEGLLSFSKDFPDGTIYFMEDNYRSSANIVSVSGQFISQNSDRYKKTVRTNNPQFEPVQILRFRGADDQYSFLVEELSNISDPSETAVLFRNNLSSIGIANALDANDIPFYTRDSRLRFFNHWLIKDIESFLRLAEDPKDKSAFENIYFKTKGYISKRMMQHVKGKGYNETVWKRLLSFPGLTEFYRRQINELELDFRRLARLKPEPAIRFIEDSLRYVEYLKDNSQRSGYTFDYLKEMLYHLGCIAKKSDNKDDFKDRMRKLEAIFSNQNRNKTGVVLSTIHSSKGLEYDHVYIVDLIEGEFPSQSSIEELNKGSCQLYEEERRIFYVGMTRARKKLHLITYDSVNGEGVKASRFLGELQLQHKKQ